MVIYYENNQQCDNVQVVYCFLFSSFLSLSLLTLCAHYDLIPGHNLNAF